MSRRVDRALFLWLLLVSLLGVLAGMPWTVAVLGALRDRLAVGNSGVPLLANARFCSRSVGREEGRSWHGVEGTRLGSERLAAVYSGASSNDARRRDTGRNRILCPELHNEQRVHS